MPTYQQILHYFSPTQVFSLSFRTPRPPAHPLLKPQHLRAELPTFLSTPASPSFLPVLVNGSIHPIGQGKNTFLSLPSITNLPLHLSTAPGVYTDVQACSSSLPLTL